MSTSMTNHADGPPKAALRHAVYPPLTGPALIWGTLALALATFMIVLDSSIANVSIPAISGDLGVSTSQGTWVITSFSVANAISIPLTGWLTQRFGQVRLFCISILLFVLASWLCGFAPNIESLIFFRVLQGAVTGPIIPLSQALLLSSYPKAKSGTALALWAMTTLVAPVMGPLLGGWITDHISWSWIFYINIPVGLFSAAMSWNLYKKRESIIHKLPIDKVGLFLLVAWVGSMQVMMDKGKELDWFHSNQIIALAVIAVVGFAFFIAWELTDDHPVVNLHLFASRNFWTGTVALSLAYGVFFGNVVLLPLWLQQYMGYTATQAGIVLAPVGLMAVLLSPFVGKSIGKVDPRILASVSFIVFALVLWMRSRFNVQTDMATIMIPTIIQGIGMAFLFIPLVSLTLSGLTPDKIPAASGLSNFARITAGAFGTSIATTLWENRATMHHAHLVEKINSANPATMQALTSLESSGLSMTQALATINRSIDQQAFMMSADDIFFASSMIFILLLGIIWLARPAPIVRGGEPAGPDTSGAH